MRLAEIRNLDIEDLISFLEDNYSQVMKKIWRPRDKVIGVFVRDELAYRTLSEQVLIITLEHDVVGNICNLTIVPAGGGAGLLRLDWGSQDDEVLTFETTLKDFARQHGWDVSFKNDVVVRFIGTRCPHCNALYSYPERMFLKDGSVICQNCAKPFFPEQVTSVPDTRE